MEGFENNQEVSTFFEKAFVFETPSLHNNCSSRKDFHRIAVLLYDLSILSLIGLYHTELFSFKTHKRCKYLTEASYFYYNMKIKIWLFESLDSFNLIIETQKLLNLIV